MVLHRWVGLAMAGFLLVAGLTGSVLVWRDELEALINPALFLAVPLADTDSAMLDPVTLRERVLRAHPRARVTYVPGPIEPGRTAIFYLAPAPGLPAHRADGLPKQVFINPYTAAIQGERRYGDITQGARNLMPFIHRLHHTLALGEVGHWVFGVVALMWTLDCLAGVYLTFPARPVRPSRPVRPLARRAWLARWWPAWQIRFGAGAHKRNLDLHRAAGLWPWVLLLLFAWSSVALNLSPVYEPTMRLLMAHQPDAGVIARLPQPQAEPGIDWRPARERARALMAAQAREHGFAVLREEWLIYDASRAAYRYVVRSSLDIHGRMGNTQLYLDANTGRLLGSWRPTGAAGGDTVTTWLTGMHMAAVGGMPFRLLITALGVAVGMLSVTGVLVWRKKRRARQHAVVRRDTFHR